MDQSYIKILYVPVEIYMHFVCIWGAENNNLSYSLCMQSF